MMHVHKEDFDTESDEDSLATLPNLILRDGDSFDKYSYSESDNDSLASMLSLKFRQNKDSLTSVPDLIFKEEDSPAEDTDSGEDSLESMPGLTPYNYDTDSSSDDDSCTSMSGLILRTKETPEYNKITPTKIKGANNTKGAELLITIPAIVRTSNSTLLALVDTCTSAFLIDHDHTTRHVTKKR